MHESSLFFLHVSILLSYKDLLENLQIVYLSLMIKRVNLLFCRDGGLKGLFTGVGPRVGRAGPSVGIVVSFYEVMKYVINRGCTTA